MPYTQSSSERCRSLKRVKWFSLVPQLDTCPKLMPFQGVILNRVQSSPPDKLKFRHISSCSTIVTIIKNQGGKNTAAASVALVLRTFFPGSC